MAMGRTSGCRRGAAALLLYRCALTTTSGSLLERASATAAAAADAHQQLRSAAGGFAFVSVSKGVPEPITGHGLDSVAAANDGSDTIWACGRSGTLEGFSVATAGQTTTVYRSATGEVPGCSALTFLHGPRSGSGPEGRVPRITGLVAATASGLVAYNITSRGAEGKRELRRTSDVPPPTAGAVTAIRLFRHFKAPTPGQVDPDALIVAASDTGELFAANVTQGGSLRVASGALPVAKLVNVSATGGATPTVGGFASWDFMGISMYLGVTFGSGPAILNSVQVSGHDNLEPEDPSTWIAGIGLPSPVLVAVAARLSF